MKKHLLVPALLLCMGTQGATAQDVVRGRVVDRDGTPIPGAKVENPKGTEQATTDLDGLFSLPANARMKRLKVSYAGMRAVTCKPEPGMTVTMQRATWWNSAPEKYSWFVGPVVTFNSVKPSYGLMFGVVKDWGGYVRADIFPGTFNVNYRTVSGHYGSKEWLLENHEFDGQKSEFARCSVTGGVIRRIAGALYVLAGGGYTRNNRTITCTEGTKLFYEPYCYAGGTAELGLMLKAKHFYAGVLASMTFAETAYREGSMDVGKTTSVSVSAGYSF